MFSNTSTDLYDLSRLNFIVRFVRPCRCTALIGRALRAVFFHADDAL
jgi:hypothetical protein